MKKEGGAKFGGVTTGGSNLGSVKKPPKEISVTIDPDSEDNDGVPPAPSAARKLRFKEQAEKIVSILFLTVALFYFREKHSSKK